MSETLDAMFHVIASQEDDSEQLLDGTALLLFETVKVFFLGGISIECVLLMSRLYAGYQTSV